MIKKGLSKVTVILIFLLIASLVVVVFAFLFFKDNYFDEVYDKKIISGELKNPVFNLNDEQAFMQFNESFVYYLLVNIKAYNLHNPPLSSNMPKIEIIVSGDSYNAIVDSGEIFVKKGFISGEDVVISTTKEEAVKMLRDKLYIQESFRVGKSDIDLKASKAILFSKGYLSIYDELVGDGITGSAISIFFN